MVTVILPSLDRHPVYVVTVGLRSVDVEVGEEITFAEASQAPETKER